MYHIYRAIQFYCNITINTSMDIYQYVNHVFKITRKMNHFEKEELKDAIGKSPDVSAVRKV